MLPSLPPSLPPSTSPPSSPPPPPALLLPPSSLPYRPGPGMPPPGPGGGGGPPGPRPFSSTTSVLGKRQPGFLDIGTKRSRIGGPQSSGRGRGTVYSSRGRGRGTVTSFGSGRGRGSASITRGGYGRGGPSLGRGTYSSRGNRGGGVGYSSWNGQQAVARGSAVGGRKCSICRQEGERTQYPAVAHSCAMLYVLYLGMLCC